MSAIRFASSIKATGSICGLMVLAKKSKQVVNMNCKRSCLKLNKFKLGRCKYQYIFTWFVLMLLITPVSTGHSKETFIVKKSLLNTLSARRRRSSDAGTSTMIPEIIPGLTEEIPFPSSLNMSNEQGWEEIAEAILSRTQRGSRDASELEMHRVIETADPGISCGSCQPWKRTIKFRKPTCAPVTISVTSCRGMCESWEVSCQYSIC